MGPGGGGVGTDFFRKVGRPGGERGIGGAENEGFFGDFRAAGLAGGENEGFFLCAVVFFGTEKDVFFFGREKDDFFFGREKDGFFLGGGLLVGSEDEGDFFFLGRENDDFFFAPPFLREARAAAICSCRDMGLFFKGLDLDSLFFFFLFLSFVPARIALSNAPRPPPLLFGGPELGGDIGGGGPGPGPPGGGGGPAPPGGGGGQLGPGGGGQLGPGGGAPGAGGGGAV